jgi:hypothetical protein
MGTWLCVSSVKAVNYCHNVSMLIYHNSNIMFKFYSSANTNRKIMHVRHAWHLKQITEPVSQVTVTRGKVRKGGIKPNTRI